ncbi:ABC transporter permease [Paenibacillus sp. MSJ-34]|uniref:ABC transporter permease n=1 Tax=Paenibacillus sp. MSJ-34 TaxID=2841529 RepID=UPI001C1165D2|nr:ABC transporter permease [Paenibacillus sp. MSJ-34]MBU5440873.1 ABC transporter permease [Paenibacillus sp. MSJ-34]
MRLDQLWQRRRQQYWKELFPYFRYVIQGGSATLLAFVIIAFSAYYVWFLQNIPESFPIRYIALLVLAPFVTFSSFRTFLQPADIIFLLPMEPRMKEYFRGSWKYSMVQQSIWLFIAFGILWPLYVRADADPKPFVLLLAVWLILKAINSHGSWRERNMNRPLARESFRMVRWAFSVGMIAVWLWQPVWKAAVFSAIAAITYIMALRLPLRYPVAWERLIRLEQEQQGRILMFMNLFVDMPATPQRVYKRSWMNWAAGRIPFRRESAYFYLFTKSFLRGEVFGMAIRLTVLGLFVLFWVRDSAWAVALYGFFALVIGMQLTAVRQLHSYSFWRSIYPLPDLWRKRAIVQLVFRAHCVFAVILYIPLAFGGLEWLLKLLPLPGGLLLAAAFRSVWSRQKWFTSEDDV